MKVEVSAVPSIAKANHQPQPKFEELMIIDPIRCYLTLNRVRPDMRRFKHNWRLDMLAIPKGHSEETHLFSLKPQDIESYKRKKEERKKRKYDEYHNPRYLKSIQTCVDKSIKQLVVMPSRVYASQKRYFSKICGKAFEKKMAKLLEESKKTVYKEYTNARARQSKGKKTPKKGKAAKKQKSAKAAGGDKKKKPAGKEGIAEAIAYCAELAHPKKIHLPPKLERGPFGEVPEEVLLHLAKPKHYTPKFVDDSMTTWKFKHFVPPNTMLYRLTERTAELAQTKTVPFEEPIILGSVEPNALIAKATPRVLELALPKAKSAVTDMDYNENAFKVSPTAMKYKASERILELAKPLQRK